MIKVKTVRVKMPKIKQGKIGFGIKTVKIKIGRVR